MKKNYIQPTAKVHAFKIYTVMAAGSVTSTGEDGANIGNGGDTTTTPGLEVDSKKGIWDSMDED